MKRKKVVIHWANLIIVLGVLLILGYGTYTIFNHFKSDEVPKDGEVNEKNEAYEHLIDLGYSEKDANKILSNMKEENVLNMNKKYDLLATFIGEKYFNIENIDRYTDLKNNSDYDVNEVIMRVNTSIDKPFYTDIKTVDNPNDLLVLVNKYYALPSGIEPTDLISVKGVKMQREAGEALESMLNAINAEGLYLQAQSGYRSEDTQRSLYNRYVARDGQEEADTYSARPNHSEHQTGLAIDVSIDGTLKESFEKTEQFEWLSENAHKYGFILRYLKDKVYMTGYTYEPWHYRYVGVEVATIIKNEGITFEEYYVKYKGLY